MQHGSHNLQGLCALVLALHARLNRFVWFGAQGQSTRRESVSSDVG